MFGKKNKNNNDDSMTESNKEEQQVGTEQLGEETITSDIQTEQSEGQTEQQTDGDALSAEEKLKQENAALNDKYLRLFAEFDNFKRRTQKERIELLQTAGKDVIISLLPVLDDFDRANKAMETAADISSIREGLALVHTKLKSVLGQKGLKEMVSINETFDTDNHEAITKIPAPNEEMKGKVIDELEKGYTLNDKVIRFAKVVVGS
ncbi:nucleotide exchange factor GrpE [Pedobacter deserti]|uniref:nucleotide exchange factor GrpE n=1 Tax=Pedobacter deserti TaxID=2817382 RepID=UPI00210BD74D|nr:nucleotide exchange factor GrpE [Pedobacter sp. SYSU D00382]